MFQVLMNGEITLEDLPPTLDVCQVRIIFYVNEKMKRYLVNVRETDTQLQKFGKNESFSCLQPQEKQEISKS